MISTRRDFLHSLSTIIGSSFLLTDNALAKIISDNKINDPNRLAKQYLLKKESSYLNHASIGTVPKVIHEAHIKYLKICESNPSLYIWGEIWKDVTETTRQLASSLIHCNVDDLAITHNTTEGFNILAHGIQLSQNDEVLFINKIYKSEFYYDSKNLQNILISKTLGFLNFSGFISSLSESNLELSSL